MSYGLINISYPTYIPHNLMIEILISLIVEHIKGKEPFTLHVMIELFSSHLNIKATSSYYGLDERCVKPFPFGQDLFKNWHQVVIQTNVNISMSTSLSGHKEAERLTLDITN